MQISKQDDHEFYELVNNYFRGRNTLAMAIREYEVCFHDFCYCSRDVVKNFDNQNFVLDRCLSGP